MWVAHRRSLMSAAGIIDSDGRHDTIVAPATAQAPAGVAVVRLSGPRALQIGAKIGDRDSHDLSHGQMRFGHLHGADGPIDEGYVVAFHAPRSFTTEHVVEIHCHGATAVVRAICDAAVHWGARPAKAGEFTRRAWLGGRLDLVQAEALLDLISADSDRARQQALAHLDGRLSSELGSIRTPLLSVLADLEARLDFATEQDVDDLNRDQLCADLSSLVDRLQHLVQSAEAGRLRVHGLRVALYGAPNAGKSTLFNGLVGSDRALVHDQPGTTRDHVEANSVVDGFGVTWVDTAGIRETQQEVEAAGIERARQAAIASDIVIWLTDRSGPMPEMPTPPGWQSDSGPVVLAYGSHADRSAAPGTHLHHQWPAISALEATDVERIRQDIASAIRKKTQAMGDALVLTRARQARSLAMAAEHLERACQALAAQMSLELPSADVRDAIDQLDEVTGRVVPDDVLEVIFSQFCIGK
ncbi:MAG: tRNA uridine-5-carboxymethylaminomethyl(34) synthesis GTPase MnmE [Myxococcales bacterium]|nr:tRNA uridine-5-carboxymethylaminomethyl(34) synthesis GTPase MnmE [Myxococcales bacterium]